VIAAARLQGKWCSFPGQLNRCPSYVAWTENGHLFPVTSTCAMFEFWNFDGWNPNCHRGFDMAQRLIPLPSQRAIIEASLIPTPLGGGARRGFVHFRDKLREILLRKNDCFVRRTLSAKGTEGHRRMIADDLA